MNSLSVILNLSVITDMFSVNSLNIRATTGFQP